MGRCKCQKKDKKQCTRKGSSKETQDPLYCWQHQKCKKDFGADTVTDNAPPAEETIFSEKKGPIKEGKAPPFIQNSDKMVAYDLVNGLAGLKSEEAVLIENVTQGLWEVKIKGHLNENGELIDHIEFDAYATGINTTQCHWEYEGVVTTSLGMVGLFDLGTLSKKSNKDLEDLAKASKPMNYYKFGVYLQTQPQSESEIYLCYDSKKKVVAIRSKLTSY